MEDDVIKESGETNEDSIHPKNHNYNDSSSNIHDDEKTLLAISDHSSVSISKKTKRAQSKHLRNTNDRDIPKVSDYLKYARSTFVMKSPNNNHQLKSMLIKNQDDGKIDLEYKEMN